MKRRSTRLVKIGDVPVGAGHPISVQSMTNTRTSDAKATLEQIAELKAAGCEIIRVAVPDRAAVQALPKIVAEAGIPVVADIHFNHQLAIASARAGVQALRINPGNIGGRDRVLQVIRVCQEKGIPVRIGVNSGSLEKDLKPEVSSESERKPDKDPEGRPAPETETQDKATQIKETRNKKTQNKETQNKENQNEENHLKNLQNKEAHVKNSQNKKSQVKKSQNTESQETETKNKHQTNQMAKALVASAARHIEYLTSEDFHDIIVSLKSSSVPETLEANRLFAERFDYPLHIGITESGAGRSGEIKSASGIAALLSQGLGDTVRVSLTGHPIQEVQVAYEILASLGLRRRPGNLEIISCPTCGRTEIDLERIVREVRQALQDRASNSESPPLTVAVMGCAVNGPGEAARADIGLAGGKESGVIFRQGKIVKKVPEEELVSALLEEIKKMECE